MHEMSLAQGLLDLVLESWEKYNSGQAPKAGKIREIKCQAGLLGGFEYETLNSCFEIISEGTAAENAVLKIETMPLSCLCEACGKRFDLTERHFKCPDCGSEQLKFKGGNGLILEAITVAGEEEDNA